MLEIFSDGGSRGNPGKAASAYVIYKEGKIIKQDSKYLGIATNNVAEYEGVILALEWVEKNLQFSIYNFQTELVKFYMDSELVVKQLNGLYKIKDKKLIALSMKARELIARNKLQVQFIHIMRERNKLADKLVNEKLDDSSRL